ncbi:hypothetical protein GXW82_25985 [Streptacidiphilus sp. 4-A2]|nr:hypothetical protein [Streptacidiphilus sp. 4-A2]
MAVLPLLALLLALTVGTFGAEVLTGISDGRAQAAVQEVGADADVSSILDSLPPALVTAVSHSAGVRSVVAIQQDVEEQFGSTGLSYDVNVSTRSPMPRWPGAWAATASSRRCWTTAATARSRCWPPRTWRPTWARARSS